MAEYRALERAAGRTLPITAFAVEHDTAVWPAYRDAGIERIVLSVDPETAELILPKLDSWAKAGAEVA